MFVEPLEQCSCTGQLLRLHTTGFKRVFCSHGSNEAREESITGQHGSPNSGLYTVVRFFEIHRLESVFHIRIMLERQMTGTVHQTSRFAFQDPAASAGVSALPGL